MLLSQIVAFCTMGTIIEICVRLNFSTWKMGINFIDEMISFSERSIVWQSKYGWLVFVILSRPKSVQIFNVERTKNSNSYHCWGSTAQYDQLCFGKPQVVLFWLHNFDWTDKMLRFLLRFSRKFTLSLCAYIISSVRQGKPRHTRKHQFIGKMRNKIQR